MKKLNPIISKTEDKVYDIINKEEVRNPRIIPQDPPKYSEILCSTQHYSQEPESENNPVLEKR